MSEPLPLPPLPWRPMTALRVACDVADYSMDDILGTNQHMPLTCARQFVFWAILKSRSDWLSLDRTAAEIGYDRSTLQHGMRKTMRRIHDKALPRRWMDLVEYIETGERTGRCVHNIIRRSKAAKESAHV